MQNMIKPTLYLSVLVGLVGCGSTVTGATGSNDATIAPIGVITSTAISTALVADASVTDLDNDGIAVAEDIDSDGDGLIEISTCLLYTSPSPRDQRGSRMPSSA